MALQRHLMGVVIVVSVLFVAGCGISNPLSEPPTIAETSATHEQLLQLPPPRQPVVVAVYNFEDQTGQFRFSPTVQTLSRAVTQGATSMLIKALQDAGGGKWFTVVEREKLDNLLKERQIIREMRARYEGNNDLSRNYLPPMKFAGLILDGGIIAFDTNTLTGGAGARYMNIGGSVEYRHDTVTVYLRAISTQTGEVLKSVLARKSLYSVGLDFNVFRFIGTNDILELEAGITSNEPTFLALKQAIERTVVAMVIEGASNNLWQFANPADGQALIDHHFAAKKAVEDMTVEDFEEQKKVHEEKEHASRKINYEMFR